MEENRIYQFYNEYEFQDENGKEIKEFGKENLLRTYLRIRVAETKSSMPVEEQEIIYVVHI